jgi:hypothetical protein
MSWPLCKLLYILIKWGTHSLFFHIHIAFGFLKSKHSPSFTYSNKMPIHVSLLIHILALFTFFLYHFPFLFTLWISCERRANGETQKPHSLSHKASDWSEERRRKQQRIRKGICAQLGLLPPSLTVLLSYLAGRKKECLGAASQNWTWGQDSRRGKDEIDWMERRQGWGLKMKADANRWREASSSCRGHSHSQGITWQSKGTGTEKNEEEEAKWRKGKYRLAGKWAAIQSMRADGRKPRRQLLDGTAKLMTRPCQLKWGLWNSHRAKFLICSARKCSKLILYFKCISL